MGTFGPLTDFLPGECPRLRTYARFVFAGSYWYTLKQAFAAVSCVCEPLGFFFSMSPGLMPVEVDGEDGGLTGDRRTRQMETYRNGKIREWIMIGSGERYIAGNHN